MTGERLRLVGVLLAPWLLAHCGFSGSESGGYTVVEVSQQDVYQPPIGPDASPWPNSDPTPDASVHGSPQFDSGAAPEAGPVRCQGKLHDSGDRVYTVQSSGVTRVAIIHVPPSYDPTRGAMLVMNFHGFMSDAPQELILSRMNSISDEKGFLIAYPYGRFNSWNAGQCCGDSWLDNVDDIQFVKDLFASLSDDYCIDPKRVYATGMSNGGFFSHRLGCELSDMFAAIAPVAGVLGMPSDGCIPPRPVPIIDFHGTKDNLVPYSGGIPFLGWQSNATLSFPSVAETMDGWRLRNRCAEGNPETIYQKGDASCVRWNGCPQKGEVVLCVIEGGGHTWPGGTPVPVLGYTSDNLSASETMIEFFQAHPMP